MRLTRLEIENFKGIGERQVIEIRPITLLFGPNSAGKTTILQAVEYLRAFLSGGAPIYDLGSFSSLVHCHDSSKTIRIKADFNFENELSEYFPQNVLEETAKMEISDLPINYLKGSSNSCKVSSFSVKMEQAKEEQSLEIEINYQKILKINHFHYSSFDSEENHLTNSEYIVLPAGGFNPFRKYEVKKHTLEINPRHHLLKNFTGTDQVEYDSNDISQNNVYKLQSNGNDQLDRIREQPKKERVEKEPDSRESKHNSTSFFEKELLELVFGLDAGSDSLGADDYIALDIARLVSEDTWTYNVSWGDISQKEQDGYSNIRKPIDIVPKENYSRLEKYSSTQGKRWLRLEDLLSELVFAPIRCAIVAISLDPHEQSVRSLRPIPERGKSGTILDNNSYDALKLTCDVNFWLTDNNLFNLAYKIRRFILKYRIEEQTVDSDIDEELRLDDISSGFLSDISEEHKVLVKLYDKKRKIYLDFLDVGVGISQLVPVLVEALKPDKYGLVAIEQPELHLHPAMQVILGDLFIASSTNRDRTFLIETHSEHLLLRLLRRIQEATDNELPPDTVGLRAEDLSVIHVEAIHTKMQKRTRIMRLRVDQDGEFEDRWPKGFFEEREKELF